MLNISLLPEKNFHFKHLKTNVKASYQYFPFYAPPYLEPLTCLNIPIFRLLVLLSLDVWICTFVWSTGGLMISQGKTEELWQKPNSVPILSITNISWKDKGVSSANNLLSIHSLMSLYVSFLLKVLGKWIQCGVCFCYLLTSLHLLSVSVCNIL
jgi:hypothetical protein